MTVAHRHGSYEVEFRSVADALDSVKGALVITDENVFRHWGHCLAGARHTTIAPGETSKSVATYGRLLEWLADQGARRSDTVVAFGGGVVGDVAGFAAATYMRGIKLVQVATSDGGLFGGRQSGDRLTSRQESGRRILSPTKSVPVLGSPIDPSRP